MFKIIYIKKYIAAALGVTIALACAVYMGYGYFIPKALCKEKDIAAVTDAENMAQTEQNKAPSENVVYLTFDDGPSKVTSDILDILKENDVTASFFVMADENHTEYFPLLSRAIADGHVIALHSRSHKYSEIYKSSAAFWSDIDALRDIITPYVGEVPNILRFPGGSTNTVSHRYGGANIMKTLKREAEEKGYIYVDWNVCANDAIGGHPSAEKIYSTVTKGAKNLPECIVLFHDTNATKTTAAALSPIIKYFKDKGYRFDTVDHLKK